MSRPAPGAWGHWGGDCVMTLCQRGKQSNSLPEACHARDMAPVPGIAVHKRCPGSHLSSQPCVRGSCSLGLGGACKYILNMYDSVSVVEFVTVELPRHRESGAVVHLIYLQFGTSAAPTESDRVCIATRALRRRPFTSNWSPSQPNCGLSPAAPARRPPSRASRPGS